MALGVLTEATSRLSAERARARTAAAEQQWHSARATREAEEKTQRLARTVESRQVRQWRKLAADPRRLGAHLRDLPVQEVARHWQQAANHAGADPVAARVLTATEQELRHRLPTLMAVYDNARGQGTTPIAAMRTAVMEIRSGRVRPHGATGYAAGALSVLDHELEKELRRTAGKLDPLARSRWLRSLEERGWSPESLAWAETILTRADHGTSHQTRVGQPAAGQAGVNLGDQRHPASPVRLARLSYPTPAVEVLRSTILPQAVTAPVRERAGRKEMGR